MRNEWYGDRRDVVKWTSLLHLAQREEIDRIVQIAMCTDMEPAPPEITTLDREIVQCQAVAAQVANHFHHHNDLNGIRPFGQHFGIDVEVRLAPFAHPGRGQYFDNVLNEIRASTKRTIWFFDPDTGIEPQGGANEKHVRLQELLDAFKAMRSGDYLACYQHAWREDNWQTLARNRLAARLDIAKNRVEVFASDYASDVIILAVEKPDSKATGR